MIGERLADIAYDHIHQFCEKYPIQKLMLFGSILRDDFRAESDIDMLVEFRAGIPVTFFDMVDMQAQLSAILGRQVDFLTPGFLSPHFLPAVLEQAVTLYERP